MQRHSMLAAVAALALAALPARASEVRATVGAWDYDFAGDVDDRGTHYDFQDDLGVQPRRSRGVALEVDTPKGGWPDFAAGYTPLSANGERTEEVMFPLPSTRTIRTDADFDTYELVARWPLNRGRLRFSAGLAVQQLKGELIIDDSDETQPRHERYDETFPLLHAQLRAAGKVFGFSAVAQGIEYDGSSARELRALVELRFLAPLLIEAGWQERRYEIELADYALDARLSGALLRFGVLYR